MGENSKIEWTTHTFNAWRGCEQVSPACDNCYAMTMALRNPAVLGSWGAEDEGGTRIVASEAMWANPAKWNKNAEGKPGRPRVFTNSLADVFEDWRGPMLDSQGRVLHYNSAATWWVPEPTMHGLIPIDFVRTRLFNLIEQTPNLDWMLLTKRPERIYQLWTQTEWPRLLSNAWLGTTVENCETKERINILRRAPARVRFLSIEPLLEDLGELDLRQIDLVIAGGESGHGARPMHPNWVRNIQSQCSKAGVPFFFKQWGDYLPCVEMNAQDDRRLAPGVYVDFAGKTYDENGKVALSGYRCCRVGKKAAGRMLDGRTWDEMPISAASAIS